MSDPERPVLFTFTDYKCSAKYWENFVKKNKVKYLGYGKEKCPTTHRPHFQGVVQFESGRTFEQAKKLMKSRHVEEAEYPLEVNIKYCSKGGDYVVVRDWKPAQGKRTDLATIYQLLLTGTSIKEISLLYPVQWTMYNRAFDKFIVMHKLEPVRTWITEVIILQGKTRTGKTTKAFEDGAHPVIISGDPRNPFVGDYYYEEVVLFDDFDPDSCTVTWFLKITDKHKFSINTKNSKMSWVPKRIYITTNEDAKTWWKRTPQHEAWLARISRIEHFE